MFLFGSVNIKKCLGPTKPLIRAWACDRELNKYFKIEDAFQIEVNSSLRADEICLKKFSYQAITCSIVHLSQTITWFVGNGTFYFKLKNIKCDQLKNYHTPKYR